MAKTSIEHRRKLRALEAKRDALMAQQDQAKIKLANTRTELNLLRKRGAK